MSAFGALTVLGLSVPTIILYCQYKNYPLSSKLKTLRALTVTLTVFTVLDFVWLLDGFGLLSPWRAEARLTYLNYFTDDDMYVRFSAGASLVLSIAFLVFGIVCCVKGYTITADKPRARQSYINERIEKALSTNAKICSRCGQLVPYNNNVCRCGSTEFTYPQINMIDEHIHQAPAAPPQSVCAKCGTPIAPGDNFCHVCGTPKNN